MNFLDLVGRKDKILEVDVRNNATLLSEIVQSASFLVVGGAGTIGQSVVKELFKRNPKKLDVIDISENNLVELTRDIRSSLGYIQGEFRTLALDVGSVEFDCFWNDNGNYDYILNLSALKHVRSEKDPYTLSRMVRVNILNSVKLAEFASSALTSNYFCVSTDKAANPVNMMGASKRLMEQFIIGGGFDFDYSLARFANVAFSDGSLPYGFLQRIIKNQPISAPHDVKRYFVTPQEAGELCLMSALLGKNNEIFFPRNATELKLTSFKDVAINYLSSLDLTPIECETEYEARDICQNGVPEKHWPCHFFESDTTGEKPFEEFFRSTDVIDNSRFNELGIITSENNGLTHAQYEEFVSKLYLNGSSISGKDQMVALFKQYLPEFEHAETGKFLDQRM